MDTTILVADDEHEVRLILKQVFEAEQFRVLTAGTADECFALAVQARPDLILADVVMPEKDGLFLCRELKKDQRTADIPIILLSGILLAPDDQIRGLDEGADDYLSKPADNKLLVSKIRAVLRRYRLRSDQHGAVSAEGLVLDARSWTVVVKGKPVHLTRKEFDLLTLFLQHRGEVLKHAHLYEAVWGLEANDHTDLRTIKVHISSLRKKLGARLGNKIVSVPAVGYRFEHSREPEQVG